MTYILTAPMGSLEGLKQRSGIGQAENRELSQNCQNRRKSLQYNHLYHPSLALLHRI